jgi:hypothetical protein
MTTTYVRARSTSTSTSQGTSSLTWTEENPYPSETSESSESFAFEDLVDRMLSSGGVFKQDIADEIVNRIQFDGRSHVRAAWACYLILQSAKPGRLDDCIGIMTRLGPGTVQECIRDAFVHQFRPDGPSGRTKDYWYVLIRTLGYLCRQGYTEAFRTIIELASQFPEPAIREAAVYSLTDIGDQDAIERLVEIAKSDSSSTIREVAADCLEDAAA